MQLPRDRAQLRLLDMAVGGPLQAIPMYPAVEIAV